MSAPSPLLGDPVTESDDGLIHIMCCRRPELTVCGYDDAYGTGSDDDEVTCSFCRLCEEEADQRADNGLTILCQLDGRPCPDDYQVPALEEH